MTLHDTAGKEYTVPSGTAIFMHGYAMGLDPELWEEPEKFNPDRWLGKESVSHILFAGFDCKILK
jgi:cytochrome P450